MELVATQTSEVLKAHESIRRTIGRDFYAIEACINAFEHSETKSEIYIHFIISDDDLTIKVIDKVLTPPKLKSQKLTIKSTPTSASVAGELC